MERLTDRQRMVLDFIRMTIEELGYPPTLREIGTHLGIRSTNGVNDHLRALERKGYITRGDMKSRALKPTASSTFRRASIPELTVDVPVLGRVAAGQLLEAIEQAEDRIHVDRALVGTGSVFGLRIHGDSMIEAGIHDGDYVFVRQQAEAKRGEVVVALVGEEATCKYYFPENDYVRLQPANGRMAPILIHKSDWRSAQVLGVVVGVFRRLAS
jgi:repressor LexA